MFKQIKEQYLIENDKVEYFKNVHKKIMSFRDISELLENSEVKEVVFGKNGAYLKMNDSYNNLKIMIDDNDFEEVPISLLCFGEYEIEETAMVKEVLLKLNKKNIVFFDIGANLGWYSLNILKKFKNSEVYAFEPSPETYQRLKNNFKLNKFDINNINNCGLFNENKTMDFYYDIAGSGASSLRNIRERETVAKIQVNVEKLDDWCDKHHIQNIDFIKCDVEGAEYFVYQGGKKYIEMCKPIVFSEMLRKWSSKFNYHPNDIIQFFKNLDYKCFVIKNGNLREINKVTEETVETNYFFLHETKHRTIIEELGEVNEQLS